MNIEDHLKGADRIYNIIEQTYKKWKQLKACLKFVEMFFFKRFPYQPQVVTFFEVTKPKERHTWRE